LPLTASHEVARHHSDTVWIPGKNGNPAALAAVTNAGVPPGLTATGRRPANLRELGRFQEGDRRPRSDRGDSHSQTLQPPSITLTVPVVNADSSLAR
jgi:hypothetical protein